MNFKIVHKFEKVCSFRKCSQIWEKFIIENKSWIWIKSLPILKNVHEHKKVHELKNCSWTKKITNLKNVHGFSKQLQKKNKVQNFQKKFTNSRNVQELEKLCE